MAIRTMPHRKGRISREDERRVIWRLLIELYRIGHDTHQSWDSVTLLVCAVVALSHVEGRRIGASQIARVLNVPRPTVIRKLRKPASRGDITRVGTSYLLNEDRLGPITPHITSGVRAIERAYFDLAKIGAVRTTSPGQRVLRGAA
jgi:hypothetical protein